MRMPPISRFGLFLVCCSSFVSTLPVAAQTYSWHRAQTLPAHSSWHSIAFNPRSNGRVIFAGSAGTDGVFRSDDGGITWGAGTNAPDNSMNDIHQLFCVPSDTNIVLAVTPNNFYRSTNGGYDWTSVSDLGGIDGEDIAYHQSDDAIYYGQNFALQVWKSLDHGANWTATGQGANDSIGLCSLGISQDTPPTVIQGSEDSAGTPVGLLARSNDEGATWQVTMHSDTGQKDAEVPKVVFSYFATNSKTGRRDIAIVTRTRSYPRSIVATDDGGVTWRTLSSPSRMTWGLDIDQRAGMISKFGDAAYPLPLHFFVGFFFEDTTSPPAEGMVQETTDGGATWHSTNFPSGGSASPTVKQIWILKYDTLSGRIAVATDSGVYVTDATLGSVATELTSNPTLRVSHLSGAIEIESDVPIQSLRLFDMIGRPVVSVSPHQSLYRMSTTGLTAGIYALEIMQTGGSRKTILLPIP